MVRFSGYINFSNDGAKFGPMFPWEAGYKLKKLTSSKYNNSYYRRVAEEDKMPYSITFKAEGTATIVLLQQSQRGEAKTLTTGDTWWRSLFETKGMFVMRAIKEARKMYQQIQQNTSQQK